MFKSINPHLAPLGILLQPPLIQTQIKENIKAPRHWPLCGEFTGTGEFPAQRAHYAENVSIWWRHHDISKRGHNRTGKVISTLVFVCEGNPLIIVGFPPQRVSNLESVAMSWRFHDWSEGSPRMTNGRRDTYANRPDYDSTYIWELRQVVTPIYKKHQSCFKP